jgi:hypothetical protein
MEDPSSLRKVAEAMNSIVIWDASTKTASVIKPQVNIMFTETKDGIVSSGSPSETIPYWTEYDKYLTYISMSGFRQENTRYYALFIRLTQKADCGIQQLLNPGPYRTYLLRDPRPLLFFLLPGISQLIKMPLYMSLVSIKDSSGNFSRWQNKMELR